MGNLHKILHEADSIMLAAAGSLLLQSICHGLSLVDAHPAIPQH